MSMAGVLAYRPDRGRAKLIFQTKPGSYNTESLIEYLTQLRRHLRGKPVILIWDGLSAHVGVRTNVHGHVRVNVHSGLACWVGV